MNARVEPFRAGLAIVTLFGLVVSMIMIFGGVPALGHDGGQGSTCPDETDGWSSHFDDSDHTETGPWGQIVMHAADSGADEELTATINEGYVVEICVKQATGHTHFTVDEDSPSTVWEGDLSHWSYRVVQEPEPEEFRLFLHKDWKDQTGSIPDPEGLTVTLFVDGVEAPVTVEEGDVVTITETVEGLLPEGCTYESDAPFDYTVDADHADDGLIEVIVTNTVDCEEEPEPETGTIVVVKEVAEGDAQDVAFTFNATGFTLSDNTLAHNESGSAEVAAGGDYSVSETVLAGWELVSATCDSTDEADDSTPADINVSDGETVTCTFLNRIVDDVAGTTITTSTTTTAPVVEVTTTIPDEILDTEIEAEELPFTGVDSELLVGMAVLMLMSGLLVLGLTGKREDA